MLVVVMAAAVLFGAAGPSGAGELPPGGSFTDDNGNVHEPNIEAVAAAGITRGCNPPANTRFCPSDPVTRGQMAAFLVRALGLSDDTDAIDFSDDDGSVFEGDIGRLSAAGITRGCNPPANTRFCPSEPVTRGQMAAFLVRSFGLAPADGDPFSDDDGSVFENDITRLAAAGITRGCNPPANTRFCPSEPVTRAQMATFLARALDLDPIGPPPPGLRCSVFPSDNIWNTRIDDLPVHPRSDDYLASLGTGTLHPDFGSGVWPPGSNAPIGIPFVEVDSDQPDVPVVFTAYGSESDPGPYPIPADAPVEGGPAGDGDRHVLVVDTDDCTLYELYRAFPNVNGSWSADSAAKYDLGSHALRPDGWTSADAAGLPIFPGLVRYDEVAAGRIEHAIRFTASQTQRAYVWPARHFASSITDAGVPPMGQRFRLESDYDVSEFSPQVRVILTAFKEYGIILADNGSSWFISGAPDERWDNDVLRELRTVPGSAFEAVDVSSLIVHPNSGQAG